MIKSCVAWRGIYTPTYQCEIEDWKTGRDESGLSIFHCSDVDPYDEECGLFTDGSLFDSEEYVLLFGTQEWNAETIVYTLQEYDKSDLDVHLGIVCQQGQLSKRVMRYVTDYRERGIPYDPEDMSDWIVKWLKQRGILVSRDVALQVAHHVGYDIGSLVDALQAIVQVYSGRIDKVQFFDHLKQVGETDIWDLTSYMTKGDRSKVAETMTRLEGQPPLYLLSILIGRFRAYVALLDDPDADVSQFKVSDRARKYVLQEARKLTLKRAMVGLNYISTVNQELKSGGTGLSQQDSLRVLADRLTMLFARSSR